MKKIFKLEFFFILLSVALFILYLIFQNSFWDFLLVPVGNYNNNFTDLKCVQTWERLYDNFLNSNIIYNNNSGCGLNYPKIWVIISKFILQDKYFNIFLLFNFLFYNWIFYYFIKKYQSYYLIYFYLSGVSLLLLERGNVEIFIFILLFLSLMNKGFLKIVFLSLSILLKIFPIFAIISLINKKYFKTFIIVLLISISYFYISFMDLKFIFLNTPKSGDISYGTMAIVSNLNKHFNINFNHLLLSGLFIILTILFYKIYFAKFSKKFIYKNEEMFLVGGGIYCATFLLNSNHDYRLIFLIFVIPLILKLHNRMFSNFVLSSLIISSEIHRLIYFFGFFGGVINTLFKILLFFSISLILLDIIIKNFYKLWIKNIKQLKYTDS